jgi:hypothetical protein
MTVRNTLKTLLVIALALPVVECVLLWTRGLLTSMGDPEGAAIVSHVGTGCLVLWSIAIVGLVIVLAIIAVRNERAEDESGRK